MDIPSTFTPTDARAPLAYRAEYEQRAQDELDTIRALQNVFAWMVNRVREAEGRAHRAVHAKGHALLRGTLTVPPGLPAHLAQGLFAAPGQYATLLRWSSPPPEHLPDSVSTPRAVAFKIIGVPGARLDDGAPGLAGASQDFLMVNAPAFALAGPQAVLPVAKLAAAVTGRLPRTKTVASRLLRGAEAAIEALGGESVKIKGAGGEPQRHPLGATYYTQTPFLYGPWMAKFALAPVSANLLALSGAALGNDGDAQRAAIGAVFAEAGAVCEWELRVQLCVDLDAMPIEDAAVVWPEALSPYVAVAKLAVPAQAAWDPDTSPGLEEETAFDPWNCLAAHRPLGAVNRARREVMAVSRAVRSEANGCPIREPGAASPGA